MNCLLCDSSDTSSLSVKNKPARTYFHCQQCDLVFMHPRERLLPGEEKARYDLHQNEETSGYRQFLQPLIRDLQTYSESASRSTSSLEVLDYGCGPTAFFSTLLAENSYKTTNYDPFYFPDQGSLQISYDIITSTEVWEHFHEPRKELAQLAKLLKPLGILAVMTASHPGVELFHEWSYRRDLTHVIFFSEKTMRWIGKVFHLKLLKAQTPYWIFQKLARDASSPKSP
ncbi:MAG: class I SAM-dependent methyltransferase [Pseudobdellovibrionaceae bacterium]